MSGRTDSGRAESDRTDSDAELFARLAEAERENVELRERLGGSRQRWRAALSTLLIVLGAVLAPVATVGSWAHALLTDTDRFVAEFSPLAQDAAVQRFVTDEAVAVIEREIDLPALTAALIDGIEDLGAPSTAVSAARALETPINVGLSGLVRTTVDTVVTSDAFSTGWSETLRLSHSQLTRTLQGDPGAALSISGDGSLGLQLAPVLESIQQALVAQGLGIAASIPVVDMTIPVAENVSLSGIQGGYGLVTVLGQWLPWVGLALLTAGVLVARRRRRALIGAAIGLALAMGVLLLGIAVAGQTLPAVTPIPADAASAILGAVTAPISHTAAAVLTVALLLVIVGWFTGPSTLPTRLRALSGAATDRLREVGDRYGIGTGSFGEWCERWQRALRIVIAVAAGAVVLVSRPLTPGLVVGTLVGAVVALVVLDVLRRPRAVASDR